MNPVCLAGIRFIWSTLYPVLILLRYLHFLLRPVPAVPVLAAVGAEEAVSVVALAVEVEEAAASVPGKAIFRA